VLFTLIATLAALVAVTLPAGGPAPTRVRLATGVELDVLLQGRPDGEPVLFLHGYTDSPHSWSRVLALLPADIRAIVPAQRGHGDSDRPACCYGIADLANDAVALLDALGIPRATVVGHSLGSLVAQRVAMDHPARVSRLVLVSSGHSTRPPALVGFGAEVGALTDPVPEAFVREFQQSTLTLPVPEAFFEGVVAETAKLPARVWRDVMAGMLAQETVGDHGRVEAPTLVVWGAKDGIWDRAEQEALVRAVRGARLTVYEDAGHAPNWELPERLAADLLRFLGR
jgi:non-heme chloroperoxidase